jgi:hypothetical protein
LRAPSYQTGEEADGYGVTGFLPLLTIILQTMMILSIVGMSIAALRLFFVFFAHILEGRIFAQIREGGIVVSTAIYFLFASIASLLITGAGVDALINGDYPIHSYSDVFLVSLTFTAPFLLAWAIRWLCSKYPALNNNLLTVERTMDARFRATVWIFVFFLTNLAVCTSWYCLRYDASWTVNPSWTGVFG